MNIEYNLGLWSYTLIQLQSRLSGSSPHPANLKNLNILYHTLTCVHFAVFTGYYLPSGSPSAVGMLWSNLRRSKGRRRLFWTPSYNHWCSDAVLWCSSAWPFIILTITAFGTSKPRPASPHQRTVLDNIISDAGLLRFSAMPNYKLSLSKSPFQ